MDLIFFLGRSYWKKSAKIWRKFEGGASSQHTSLEFKDWTNFYVGSELRILFEYCASVGVSVENLHSEDRARRERYIERIRTFADASQAPETNVRISGANDKDITSPVCPMNDVTCCPVSMSHKALKT